MRKLRQLCLAVVLTLTLALTSLAGDIETPGVAPPPPPSLTAAGGIETPGSTGQQTTDVETAPVDPMTEMLFIIGNVMFSLF